MKNVGVFIALVLSVACLFEAPAGESKPSLVTYDHFELPGSYLYSDMALDAEGRAHVCYMASKKDRRVMYTRQGKDGSWTKPVLASGKLPKVFGFGINGPNIEVSSAGVVHIQMGWKGQIYDSRSTDGKTFTLTSVRKGDPGGTFGGTVLTGTNGRIYATWVDNRNTKTYIKTQEKGAGDIFFNMSTDDGKSWSKPVKISKITACVCCAPNIVAQGDTIAVSYRSTAQAYKEVRVLASHDGGKTWGVDTQVSKDDFLFPGCLEMKPDMAIAPDGKHVLVMWSAHKTYRGAISHDGGKTFEAIETPSADLKFPVQLMWSGSESFIAIPANRKSSLGQLITLDGKVIDHNFERKPGYYKAEAGPKTPILLTAPIGQAP